MRLAKKIGDDWAFDVRNVKSGRTGQALDDSVVIWKLYNREETVVANGSAALYDGPTASFDFMIAKAITVEFEVQDKFRLDIIATHSGKQTTRSVELIAVVHVPACDVTTPIDFEAGALLGLATIAYVDQEIANVEIGGAIQHDALIGLLDDDHTQYILVSGARAFTGVVEGVTPIAPAHLATKDYVDTEIANIPGGGGGVTEHSDLTGLADDDHAQYSRADGTRAFTAVVAGVDPVLDAHLATKLYVDTEVAAGGGGGGGVPGGADTEIQYNNAGAFGSVAGFTFVAGLVARRVSDAATVTTVSAMVLGHNTSAVAGILFGASLDFQLDTTTTPNVAASSIKTYWNTAAHATRKATVEIGVHGHVGYTPAMRIICDVDSSGFGLDHKAQVTLKGDTVEGIYDWSPHSGATLTIRKLAGSFASPHLVIANPGGGAFTGIWADGTTGALHTTTAFIAQFGVFVNNELGTGIVASAGSLKIQNLALSVIAVYGDITNGLGGLRIGDPARLADGQPYFSGTTVIIQSGYDAKGCLQILGHSATHSAVLQEWGTSAGAILLAVGITGDLILNTGAGIKIGTAVGQKLAFWNSAPVVQPAAIADADGTLADITTKFNALLAKLRTLGLIAT